MNRSSLLGYALCAIASAMMAAMLVAGCYEYQATDATEQIRQLEQQVRSLDEKAERDSLHAIELATLATGLQATVADQDRTILRQMEEREILLGELARSRQATDRLAAALPQLLRDASTTREASDNTPDSAPLARTALASCSTALTTCDSLRASQAIVIRQQQEVIERDEQLLDAHVTRAALSDSAYATMESAYTSVRAALSSQREAFVLSQDDNASLRRQNRFLKVQRGLILTAAVASGVYLLTR